MASTPEARNTLKYLTSCALDEHTVLTADHQGVSYEFPGGMGLAPDWQARAMTPEEQRWVSACMLARTNHFGVAVQISMRSRFPSQAPSLQVSPAEAQQYSLYEGTFFGNLFAQQPVSYVCSPPHSRPARETLTAQRRVCALPKSRLKGVSMTACGMVHVGACKPAAFEQDGKQYREAISVYLPPRPAEVAARP
ncbi:MAG: hypothetical protein ABI434_07725 [Burkholderiaceae bacterium]